MKERNNRDTNCTNCHELKPADSISFQFVKFVSRVLIRVHPCSSVLAFLVLAIGISAKGGIFVFNVGSTIPDEDLNGIQNSQTISGFSGNISDVNVTLEISGGFNRDFHAYLSHDNTGAILLNRTG